MTDRCPTCGGRYTIWPPHKIIRACQDWAAEHGGPPKSSEWRDSSPWHPNYRTVFRHFGSWNAMIAAAGFTPRLKGGQAACTREEAELALVKWVFAHGRVPGVRDWQRPTAEHPSRVTVFSLYGSWNAFLVSAGYEPVKRYRSTEEYERQALGRVRSRNAARRDRDELGRLAAA